MDNGFIQTGSGDHIKSATNDKVSPTRANLVTGFTKRSSTSTDTEEYNPKPTMKPRNRRTRPKSPSNVSTCSTTSEKKEKIREIKTKAQQLKKELEEAEMRSSYVFRIKELENQLAHLNREEAKRIMHLSGDSDCSTSSEITFNLNSSQKLPDLGGKLSRQSDGKQEFDEIKRFCSQIKAGEELAKSAFISDSSSCPIHDRKRAGAGCGACALAKRKINPNMFQMLAKSANNTYNLSQIDNPKNQELPTTSEEIPTARAAGSSGGGGGSGGGSANAPRPPVSGRTSLEELKKLTESLIAEINRVRRENARNRQRIIELCVLLKQREASIKECSELLCHILNEDDGVDDVITGIQSDQLEKNIDYLRWILIRLQYENIAQKTEIDTLVKEAAEKEKTLKECKDTKDRICAEKQRKESSLVALTFGNICDFPMRTMENPRASLAGQQ